MQQQAIGKARLRYLGVSAQKTRMVVDQVRGQTVEIARGRLHFSPKRVARDVEKLVDSAVANALQKEPNLDVDQLYVSHATVDDAPPMKRARSRAMGRVFRILKRACHVSIHVDVPAKRGD